MVQLTELWLPILLSAVFIFVASSVIHMVIPLHRSDYKKLPAEDELRSAIRSAGVAPGDYVVPCPTSMKEMQSPEFLAKYAEGPVGTMTFRPAGPPAMGAALGQWFAFTIVVGVVVAYVGSFTLPAGSEYSPVFRLTGTVATASYALGVVPNSIWKGSSWVTTAKFIFDGFVYGLLTGGVFGWLWPGAA